MEFERSLILCQYPDQAHHDDDGEYCDDVDDGDYCDDVDDLCCYNDVDGQRLLDPEYTDYQKYLDDFL